MNPESLPMSRGSAQVLTPAAVGPAARLGRTRKFRKMLLPNRRIKAKGRVLDLASYYPHLIKAEQEGAFDAIFLQVADRHTKDPRYTEGSVSGLVHLPNGPDGDGLYGNIEFADEDGAKLVRKSNGRVGVSVSMVENLVREEDGQKYSWPAALQHVLMTTDPHVRGNGGWHPIELGRAEVGQTIDLSTQTYEEIEEEPMVAPADAPPQEQESNTDDGRVTLEVTPEQRDRLLTLLSDIETAQNVADGDSGGAPVGEESPDDTPAGVPANLDRESGDAIELMRGEIETERQARVELQRELQLARAESEITELERTGLAPVIIRAARPLLEQPRGTGSIELDRDAQGNPQTLDPTQVVRDVLRLVVELSKRGQAVIDLDREVGMHVGTDAEQAERNAKLAALDELYPAG